MKKIIIGIDVSKEKCDATAILVENGLLEFTKLGYTEFENRPDGFRNLLSWSRKLKPGTNDDEILFVCETTGAYDHAMCDYLFGKGMDIWRESALQIKRSSGVRRGKNDKVDSVMIAEYAMRHMDKCNLYESPDSKILELRAVFMYRRKLEQEKTSKLVRVNELEATADKSKTLSFIIRDARKSIRQLEKSIRECEKRILELIDADEAMRRNYNHLNSVKGLGIVNITAFIVFSNNFRSFRTARQMATYWGIAPFRNISGTSVDKRANVSQLSNSMLKAYISQAAKQTIEKGGIYYEYYLRLKAKGKEHLLILNNARNKLIHLAKSLVENDMDYEPNHEFLRLQRAQKDNVN